MLGDIEKEARIKELLNESREYGVSEITTELVFKGMRYILSHEEDEYEDFAKGLIDLGCNFNIDEVNEMVKESGKEDMTISEGLLRGDILTGASIICNVRDSYYNMGYAFSRIIYRDSPDAPVLRYMSILRRKVDASGNKLNIVYKNQDK